MNSLLVAHTHHDIEKLVMICIIGGQSFCDECGIGRLVSQSSPHEQNIVIFGNVRQRCKFRMLAHWLWKGRKANVGQRQGRWLGNGPRSEHGGEQKEGRHHPEKGQSSKKRGALKKSSRACIALDHGTFLHVIDHSFPSCEMQTRQAAPVVLPEAMYPTPYEKSTELLKVDYWPSNKYSRPHKSFIYKVAFCKLFISRLKLQLHSKFSREVISACASVFHGTKASNIIT